MFSLSIERDKENKRLSQPPSNLTQSNVRVLSTILVTPSKKSSHIWLLQRTLPLYVTKRARHCALFNYHHHHRWVRASSKGSPKCNGWESSEWDEVRRGRVRVRGGWFVMASLSFVVVAVVVVRAGACVAVGRRHECHGASWQQGFGWT